MGDLTLHRGAKEDGSSAHCPRGIKTPAWNFGVDPQACCYRDAVALIQDDDDDDDGDYYHGDEDEDDDDDNDDGMFHGLFCLGSKVLTEVELESPVEESKIAVTPIRTPTRRSNNSSHTSSTRELDFCSPPRVCFLDSESCSSPDAMTVVSSCQCPTQSVSSPGCKEASNALLCLSPSPEQMDHHISTVFSREGKEDERILSSEFASSHRPRCRDFGSDDYIPRLRFCKESSRRLEEESLEPSFSSDGKLFARKSGNDKCSHIVVGASAECRPVNVLLEQGANALAFTCKAGGSSVAVPGGLQVEIPTGSLPDGSTSTLLGRGRCSQDNGRRRARSLTDEDFNELRGCIDLGFVFMKDNIPDLCGTLPALEVCYAIEHGPISPLGNMEDRTSVSPGSPPISPWKVAGPGDQPHQVKARLRHWAQAVACNVRQGSLRE